MLLEFMAHKRVFILIIAPKKYLGSNQKHRAEKENSKRFDFD